MDIVEVDCTTGLTISRSMTAEESAQQAKESARLAVEAKLLAEQEAQREADLALLRTKAKSDPAIAALARLVGIPLVGKEKK